MNAMLELKMNQGLLDCSYCHLPLRPRGVAGEGAFTCFAGHMYCGRNRCTLVHGEACRGGNTYCKLLLDTVSHIKVKCDCGQYIPYCTFLDHQHECPWFLKHQRESSAKSSAPPPMRKCILEESFLLCAHCKAPLRPPLFWHCSRHLVVCSVCYGGNFATYRHCIQLEYLVQGMTMKCVTCKKNLPFSTLALHGVEDCPFKHKLQEIAPCSSAPKNCGKNKLKATIEVGEVEVGNDDDSCDDNHPETSNRVAQNAFKTPACDKKAKIATPPRQKTGNPEGKAKEHNDQMKIGAKALKSKAGNNEDRNEHRVSEQDSNEGEETANISQSRAMLQRRSGKKRAAVCKGGVRRSVRLATQHGVKQASSTPGNNENPSKSSIR